MGTKAKKGIFIFLFTILLLPFLQHCLSIVESGPLIGMKSQTPNPSFTLEGWWEGTYQTKKSAHINDSMGFRPDFVRLNNQINYWAFEKLCVADNILGKDDCILGRAYIDEYYGRDFVGTDKWRKEAIHLKMVQDTLTRLGKTFVFIHAPSAVHYFSEKIPERFQAREKNPSTNYATFKKFCDSLSINQIDCNAWFLSQKGKSKELLISRLGVHWTVYGSVVAADSLTMYLEKKRNIIMPHLHIDTLVYTDVPRQSDDDMAVILNLIYPVKKELFTYPGLSYHKDSTTTSPKAIFVGDSFLWVWMGDNFIQNVGKEWKFWYYFNNAWDEEAVSGKREARDISTFNWQSDMMNTDCIIMVYTPFNYKSFIDNTSFIEQAFKFFYPGKK